MNIWSVAAMGIGSMVGAGIAAFVVGSALVEAVLERYGPTAPPPGPKFVTWLALQVIVHVLVFGVGAFCVAELLASMSNFGLLNRRRLDPVAAVIRYAVILTFIASLRGRTYDRTQDGLVWILPIFVICLIGTWFALAPTICMSSMFGRLIRLSLTSSSRPRTPSPSSWMCPLI